MSDSILDTIKEMLGIDVAVTAFDTEITIHLNGAFMVLTQLGAGPNSGFFVVDKTTKWSDYLGTETTLEAVKTYLFLKVKIVFDPPERAAVLEAYKSQINELEFRIGIQAEGGSTNAPTVVT